MLLVYEKKLLPLQSKYLISWSLENVIFIMYTSYGFTLLLLYLSSAQSTFTSLNAFVCLTYPFIYLLNKMLPGLR